MEVSSPTIYDTCIKITSDFEGSDYTTVTPGFDGQGISLGIMQWNLGQGSLQDFILNKSDVLKYNFPVPIAPLQKLTPIECVIWSKDVMHDIHGRLKPEWIKAWKEFLSDPLVINLQKRAVDPYFHQAKCIAGKLGFKHEDRRAMAWAFDVAIQSWSLLGIDRPQINDEQCHSIMNLYDSKNSMVWYNETLSDTQKVLLIASHLRALKCKPEWRNSFFVRKATIAIGTGYVNGVLRNYKSLLK